MDNAQRTAAFHDVIQKLIPLGEDGKKLGFWEAIFNDLTDAEQEDVLKNLTEELAALEKLRREER